MQKKYKTNKEISLSHIAHQTNYLQCETAEASNAERACSSKLNNVSVGVRRRVQTPREWDARFRSTEGPVFSRANRKWADRFVVRSCRKYSFRLSRQCKHIRYKNERNRKRGRSGKFDAQKCASIPKQYIDYLPVIGLKFFIKNFYYLYTIFQ